MRPKIRPKTLFLSDSDSLSDDILADIVENATGSTEPAVLSTISSFTADPPTIASVTLPPVDLPPMDPSDTGDLPFLIMQFLSDITASVLVLPPLDKKHRQQVGALARDLGLRVRTLIDQPGEQSAPSADGDAMAIGPDGEVDVFAYAQRMWPVAFRHPSAGHRALALEKRAAVAAELTVAEAEALRGGKRRHHGRHTDEYDDDDDVTRRRASGKRRQAPAAQTGAGAAKVRHVPAPSAAEALATFTAAAAVPSIVLAERDPHNFGWRMLRAMGWQGGGIGRDGAGRAEPLQAVYVPRRRGLGAEAADSAPS